MNAVIVRGRVNVGYERADRRFVEWAKARLRRAHHFNSLDAVVGTLRFAHTTKLRSPSCQPPHFQQHRFAGVNQLFQRDAWKPLAPDRTAARQWRNVDEGGEARAAIGIDGFDRTPAQIVAEIASGIARGAGIEA